MISVTRSLGLRKNFLFSDATSNGLASFLGNTNCSNIISILHQVNVFLRRRKMTTVDLEPPDNLRGMKILDKDAFKKSIIVLSLETDATKINELLRKLKKYLLKCPNLKAIKETETENVKRVLFDPGLVKNPTDFDEETQTLFKELGLNENMFSNTKIELGYDNFNACDALKAVLPTDQRGFSGYSIIGHIIHMNLKPNLLEYKNIIGQILFDKLKQIRTVVNKSSRIDNVYRIFEMELVCGEPDYAVTVREHGFTYKFDFSKVYWNPRLSTEHFRVTNSLNMKDVLFDIFCGVGPFAIPAAKKKCMVYANDINPESVKYLQENIILNKIKDDYIKVYNKDGSDFIQNELKEKLIEVWKDDLFANKIVFVMNLPPFALDFVNSFRGLIKSEIKDLNVDYVKKHLPLVYCYFFALDTENMDELKVVVLNRSKIDLNNTEYSINFVRTTAPGYNMYQLRFVLPYEYLISDASMDNNTTESPLEEPEAKKFCMGD